MHSPIYVQCPNKLESIPSSDSKSIFFAGGVTNCPLWQDELKAKVSAFDLKSLIIYNPRRSEEFDFKKESHFQINWEFTNLISSNAVSFWFPKESICPITLLELGTCLKDKTKTVFIGCHPEYPRIVDVKIQTFFYRPEIRIVENLDALANEIKNWASENKKNNKNKMLAKLKEPLILIGIFALGWMVGRFVSELPHFLKKRN